MPQLLLLHYNNTRMIRISCTQNGIFASNERAKNINRVCEVSTAEEVARRETINDEKQRPLEDDHNNAQKDVGTKEEEEEGEEEKEMKEDDEET